MAFTINFYSFSKRENSTLQPTGANFTEQCVLKDPCSIINPVIGLDLGLTDSPAAYNYAYIPQFSRYYFITDWNFSGRLWWATMAVDVLATFRDAIGASNLYVLRSSATSNGSVPDNLYPIMEGCSTVQTEGDNLFSVGIITSGTYCIGIINQSASSFGIVDYVYMTSSQFANFAGYLLGSLDWTGITEGQDLLKAQFNPMQYIASCFWLPFELSGTPATGLNLGWWTLDGLTYSKPNIVPANLFQELPFTIQIPKHPLAASRGSYLNLSPFSRYTLRFPPFGDIPLDPTIISDDDTLYCTVRIDMAIGLGILEVKISSAAGPVIYRTSGQIGIEMPMAQIARNYVAEFSSLVSGSFGAAASLTAGNIPGAISSAMNGVGNAFSSMFPQARTSGQQGSRATVWQNAILTANFMNPVPEDNSHRGRPLCQDMILSTIPGYIMIADADIAIPGTAEENTRIKNYLEGGFFFE